MSDVLSVRQAVIEEWRLPESGEDDVLNRALCQALADLRPELYWFNQSEETLTAVADQARYARLTKGDAPNASKLPWYFWGIIGRRIGYDVDADSTPPYITVWSTNGREFDQKQWALNSSGTPSKFRVWQHNLDFWPPPSGAGIFNYRCLKDLETPYPNYTGSAWEYIGADGAAISSFDAFTNDWFTHGFDVLVARVALQYFRRYRRDALKKDEAQVSYAQARRELRKASAKMVTSGQAAAWLGTRGRA